MFLKNKLKILLFTFLLSPGTSYALNFFEMFMIKTGVALVYYQYNDQSLNYESELSKKSKVLTNFYNNKYQKVKSDSFYNLPMQQQLLVIEELNLQKKLN